METATVETGMIKFEELPALIQGMPEALTLNKNLLSKIENKAKSLLDTIEAEGMNDELDAECNNFLVQLKEADSRMKSRRTPYTKMFTAIAKECTKLEAPLDPDKPESIYATFQKHRNAFAKQKAEEQQRKEREIAKQKAISQEKVDLTAKIEQTIKDKYNNILFAFKKSANDKFNSLTLENWDTVVAEIRVIRETYPRDKFLEIAVPITAIYMPPSELAGLIFDTRESLYNECSTNFKENMEALKQHLIDQLPARKSELQDIARASASEKKRLQDEAERRQKEEEQRLADEAIEAQKQSEAQTQLNLNIAKADVAFEVENQLAEVREENNSQVRQGYIINVFSSPGYEQIAAFWFTKWGSLTPLEKLEKKSLGQMKADCEKHAHATGEKIVSKHLEYEQVFKAIAKKTN